MTTTTIVAHDAHVACRATFIAARTAMVQAAVTKRARAATRAATRAMVRAATKVVRATNVAKKEAAEKHASVVGKWTARVQARATAKAAAAPAVREAKRTASMVAKVVKAANALRLNAVRATRMAAKASALIEATMVAIDNGVARATMVVPATTVVRTARAVRVLKGPTVGLSIEQKVAYKAMRLGARRGATKAPSARIPMNDATKRQAITLACRNAHAARMAAIALEAQARALNGIMLSPATIVARAAQGAAQKAANAARKAGTTKVARTHVVIVRTGPAKNKGAKRVRVLRMHTLESIAVQAAKKAAIAKAKEDKEIIKARRWALRKAAFAARKAAMEQIASDAWMMKGVWLPEDLLRAANDWSYSVRIGAFKEARAIAYAKAPVAVAA